MTPQNYMTILGQIKKMSLVFFTRVKQTTTIFIYDCSRPYKTEVYYVLVKEKNMAIFLYDRSRPYKKQAIIYI